MPAGRLARLRPAKGQNCALIGSLGELQGTPIRAEHGQHSLLRHGLRSLTITASQLKVLIGAVALSIRVLLHFQGR